jgi:hypothetical protein
MLRHDVLLAWQSAVAIGGIADIARGGPFGVANDLTATSQLVMLEW